MTTAGHQHSASAPHAYRIHAYTYTYTKPTHAPIAILVPHDAFPSRGAPDWHRRQITAHLHLDLLLLIH